MVSVSKYIKALPFQTNQLSRPLLLFIPRFFDISSIPLYALSRAIDVRGSGELRIIASDFFHGLLEFWGNYEQLGAPRRPYD